MTVIIGAAIENRKSSAPAQTEETKESLGNTVSQNANDYAKLHHRVNKALDKNPLPYDNLKHQSPNHDKMLACMEWPKEVWKKKLQERGYDVKTPPQSQKCNAYGDARDFQVRFREGKPYMAMCIGNNFTKEGFKPVLQGVIKVAPGIAYYYRRIPDDKWPKIYGADYLARIPNTEYAIGAATPNMLFIQRLPADQKVYNLWD